MKLISLNTWGGKLFEELIVFLKKSAADIDVFCLQEVFRNVETPRPGLEYIRLNLFDDVATILPHFQGFYAASQENDEGLAIFVRENLPVINMGDTFVYRTLNALEGNDSFTMGRNIQYVQLEQNGKLYTIVNFHGLWADNGKRDMPERLEQSANIKKFLDTAQTPKILCGDFNLSPDTKSLAMLEEGMSSLIKEYGITSTRSHFYEKENKFADYILVSPDINVETFKVLQDAVSDHLPLYIEFS